MLRGWRNRRVRRRAIDTFDAAQPTHAFDAARPTRSTPRNRRIRRPHASAYLKHLRRLLFPDKPRSPAPRSSTQYEYAAAAPKLVQASNDTMQFGGARHTALLNAALCEWAAAVVFVSYHVAVRLCAIVAPS
mmetsp:Transcript_3271/g.9326  ORF Transcript_3271/g.9326 Transcript_3271/m.9326 type:complete len:132 (-) Transcript_3271:116-511(-)